MQSLLDSGPKEAAVWVLLGRVCKRLGQHDRAVNCLNTALELDSKNSSHIQELLDALHLPDGDGEDNASTQLCEDEEEGEDANNNEEDEQLISADLGDSGTAHIGNDEQHWDTNTGDGGMGELNDSIEYDEDESSFY